MIKEFYRICGVLFTNSTISLRQQEKIFALARLSLRTFNSNNYVVPTVYLFLVFIKISEYTFYEDIKYKRLSFQQFQEKFVEIINHNNTKENERELMWLEAYLLLYYNNYLNSEYNKYDRKKLYERDSSGVNKLLISSVINKDAQNELLQNFENINSGRSNEGNLDLGYFFKRIDLFEKVKFQ